VWCEERWREEEDDLDIEHPGISHNHPRSLYSLSLTAISLVCSVCSIPLLRNRVLIHALSCVLSLCCALPLIHLHTRPRAAAPHAPTSTKSRYHDLNAVRYECLSLDTRWALALWLPFEYEEPPPGATGAAGLVAGSAVVVVVVWPAGSLLLLACAGGAAVGSGSATIC